MCKIRWTEKASSNLQAIHDYIAKDSQTYASRFIKSLIKATIKLEAMPYCGRIVPEFKSYSFREDIYQNYRIIEGSENIEILTVQHCAREIITGIRQEWEL